MPAVTESRVDAGALIDAGRGTRYQRWLVALTALTITFDGIDNQLMGVAIPTVMREWSVPRSAFAPVVSLGYLGMVAGGAIAGLVGDRLGRRTASSAHADVRMMTMAGRWSTERNARLPPLQGRLGGRSHPTGALAASKSRATPAVAVPSRCVC